jgi:RNA polymerase sigma-70 factor (ECF subfamily)
MDSDPVNPESPADDQAEDSSVADAAAFTSIFERHFAAIFDYLARRVGVSVAEDLSSQTFVIAFERRSHYEPHPAGIRPWLYGIATNLIANHRRTEIRAIRAMARQYPVDHDPQDDEVERLFERKAARHHCRLEFPAADLRLSGTTEPLHLPAGGSSSGRTGWSRRR